MKSSSLMFITMKGDPELASSLFTHHYTGYNYGGTSTWSIIHSSLERGFYVKEPDIEIIENGWIVVEKIDIPFHGLKTRLVS